MQEEIKRRPGRPPRRLEPDVNMDSLAEECAEQGRDYEEILASRDLERVIIARGRTLMAPHPTETQIVRQGEDGRPVRAPTSVEYKEGFEIALDRKEADRLISLGIVHRPGEPEIYPAALSEGSRVIELGPSRTSPVNQAMRT